MRSVLILLAAAAAILLSVPSPSEAAVSSTSAAPAAPASRGHYEVRCDGGSCRRVWVEDAVHRASARSSRLRDRVRSLLGR